MPNNSNKNQGQGNQGQMDQNKVQQSGGQGQGMDRNEGQERQQQSSGGQGQKQGAQKGSQQSGKPGNRVENEDLKEVGNDIDQDRDLEDQGGNRPQQGAGNIGAQQRSDRDKNRQ